MAHDVAPILNRAPLQNRPDIRIRLAGSSASDWLATRDLYHHHVAIAASLNVLKGTVVEISI